jgi:hypothetical protein
MLKLKIPTTMVLVFAFVLSFPLNTYVMAQDCLGGGGVSTNPGNPNYPEDWPECELYYDDRCCSPPCDIDNAPELSTTSGMLCFCEDGSPFCGTGDTYYTATFACAGDSDKTYFYKLLCYNTYATCAGTCAGGEVVTCECPVPTGHRLYQRGGIAPVGGCAGSTVLECVIGSGVLACPQLLN